MENVVDSLFGTQQEEPKNQQRQILDIQKTLFGNDYAVGELYAGMESDGGSIYNFMTKFVDVLLAISKAGEKKRVDDKLMSIIKASLLMYVDQVTTGKTDKEKNLKFIATMTGFVNRFAENSNSGNNQWEQKPNA